MLQPSPPVTALSPLRQEVKEAHARNLSPEASENDLALFLLQILPE